MPYPPTREPGLGCPTSLGRQRIGKPQLRDDNLPARSTLYSAPLPSRPLGGGGTAGSQTCLYWRLGGRLTRFTFGGGKKGPPRRKSAQRVKNRPLRAPAPKRSPCNPIMRRWRPVAFDAEEIGQFLELAQDSLPHLGAWVARCLPDRGIERRPLPSRHRQLPVDSQDDRQGLLRARVNDREECSRLQHRAIPRLALAHPVECFVRIGEREALDLRADLARATPPCLIHR